MVKCEKSVLNIVVLTFNINQNSQILVKSSQIRLKMIKILMKNTNFENALNSYVYLWNLKIQLCSKVLQSEIIFDLIVQCEFYIFDCVSLFAVQSLRESERSKLAKRLHREKRNTYTTFGEIGDVLEKLGIYWRYWGYIGEIGDVLEKLRLYWRNWGYFGEIEDVLEKLGIY